MVPKEQQAGTGTFECPACSASLEVTCGEYVTRDEAYCTTCERLYVRSREPVANPEYSVEGVVIETPREEQDEYEEYYCDSCAELHENTLPDGEFEFQHPQIVGYDAANITCPCGETHNAYIAAGDDVACDCGRTYWLTVEEPDL